MSLTRNDPFKWYLISFEIDGQRAVSVISIQMEEKNRRFRPYLPGYGPFKGSSKHDELQYNTLELIDFE